MAIKCRIWWNEQTQGYQVTCTYGKQTFVESLKGVIPSGSRDYDPVTKIWSLSEQYGLLVRQLAEAAFGIGSVSFTSRQASQQSRVYSGGFTGHIPQTTNGAGTTEDAVVAFFNLVPYDAAKRCYLVAAQQLHPDKNPDNAEKMSRLNQLWERIEKEFYKR